jgi:cell division protein FtsB
MIDTEPTTNAPTLRAWLTSLLFWFAVLAAAGMYALVALSPKVLAWQEERARWRENQERLVWLERKVDYLKQVAQALESDPEFAAELARIELNASRPGDERLPVEGPLTLAADNDRRSEVGGRRSALPSSDLRPLPSAIRLPPSTLREFAEDAERRRWTLVAAAVLVVIAFTFLQDSPARRSESEDGTWLGRRYGGKDRQGN